MTSKVMSSTPRHGGASLAILVFALLSIASGFSRINRVSQHRHTTCTTFSAHSPEENDSLPLSADHSHPLINRRTCLTSQIIPSSLLIFGPMNANANDGDTNNIATSPKQQASRTVPQNKSVIVLGGPWCKWRYRQRMCFSSKSLDNCCTWYSTARALRQSSVCFLVFCFLDFGIRTTMCSDNSLWDVQLWWRWNDWWQYKQLAITSIQP